MIRDFDIDVFKLKDSEYKYEFSIDSNFFQMFEGSKVEQGELTVDLGLEKTTGFIKLNFGITGSVLLICDRSLEPFDSPLEVSKELILKFGEEETELTDEIAMIPWNTQKINVAQYIYEFIELSIPMKKLHPKFQEQELDEEEETNLIYSTSDQHDENPGTENDEETIDPRWSSLKKLKK